MDSESTIVRSNRTRAAKCLDIVRFMKTKKYKLVFTVPLAQADEVRTAIGNAGAGKIGNYSFCSFSTRGIGRFKPEKNSSPTIGQAGKIESVEEERVECQIDGQVVKKVIAALRQAHPYEEILFDLYELETGDL